MTKTQQLRYRKGLAKRIETTIRGESNQSVAEKVGGLSRETVRRYRHAQVTVPVEFIAAVCKAYGASPSWLIGTIN